MKKSPKIISVQKLQELTNLPRNKITREMNGEADYAIVIKGGKPKLTPVSTDAIKTLTNLGFPNILHKNHLLNDVVLISKIEQLQLKMETVTKERNQFQNDLETVTENWKRLQTDLETVTKERNQFQNDLETVTETWKQLQVDLELVTKERNQFQNDFQELETDTESFSKERNQLQSKLDTVTAKWKQLQGEMELITEERNQLQNDLDTAIKAYNETHNQLALSGTFIQSVEEKLKSSKKEVIDSEKSIQNLQNLLQESEAKYKQLEFVHKKNKSLINALEVEKTKNAQLQNDLRLEKRNTDRLKKKLDRPIKKAEIVLILINICCIVATWASVFKAFDTAGPHAIFIGCALSGIFTLITMAFMYISSMPSIANTRVAKGLVLMAGVAEIILHYLALVKIYKIDVVGHIPTAAILTALFIAASGQAALWLRKKILSI